jgi:hypothetical protein
MISSIRPHTCWQEKQKKNPEVLSTSPAGERELLWNGQKMI